MKRFSSVLFNIHGVDVYGYMDLFDNKDHFLSSICEENEEDKISYLKKRIQYDTNKSGRIAEIGWGLSITTESIARKLRQMTQQERTDVISHALKHNIIKRYLYTDFIDGHQLFRLKGDILFSNPCGFTEYRLSRTKDLANRVGKLCTRYGFSKLDEYGYQFAMYNQNLVLEPI